MENRFCVRENLLANDFIMLTYSFPKYFFSQFDIIENMLNPEST